MILADCMMVFAASWELWLGVSKENLSDLYRMTDDFTEQLWLRAAMWGGRVTCHINRCHPRPITDISQTSHTVTSPRKIIRSGVGSLIGGCLRHRPINEPTLARFTYLELRQMYIIYRNVHSSVFPPSFSSLEEAYITSSNIERLSIFFGLHIHDITSLVTSNVWITSNIFDNHTHHNIYFNKNGSISHFYFKK